MIRCLGFGEIETGIHNLCYNGKALFNGTFFYSDRNKWALYSVKFYEPISNFEAQMLRNVLRYFFQLIARFMNSILPKQHFITMVVPILMATIMSHTHAYKISTDERHNYGGVSGENAAHNHSGITSNAGAHSHSGRTGVNGSHSHDMSFSEGLVSVTGKMPKDALQGKYTVGKQKIFMNNAGDHSHELSINRS